MNKQTEKLYKEAVALASAELHEWNKNWQPGKHTNFEYEKVLYKKFAELIVSECLDILDDEDDGDVYGKSVRIAMIRIKKQFGVEQ